MSEFRRESSLAQITRERACFIFITPPLDARLVASHLSYLCNMPKLLALDIGTKRTGIAETDPMQIIAEAVGYVETKDLLSWLKAYVEREHPEVLVIGEPKRMHGVHSDVEVFIQAWIKKAQEALPGLNIERQDERFTSALAQKAMIDGGMKKMKRREKGIVDQISAVLILQAYMDRKSGPSFL